MERCVISSDGKDFLAITTNSLHCALVLNLFRGSLYELACLFSTLKVVQWARGDCMFSPLSGYAIFLPLSMTGIC